MLHARRILIALSILALLTLDWAALDDITTGTEPSHLLEWGMVVGSVVPLVALFRALLRRPDGRVA